MKFAFKKSEKSIRNSLSTKAQSCFDHDVTVITEKVAEENPHQQKANAILQGVGANLKNLVKADLVQEVSAGKIKTLDVNV